jgi:hypothetical protein
MWEQPPRLSCNRGERCYFADALQEPISLTENLSIINGPTRQVFPRVERAVLPASLHHHEASRAREPNSEQPKKESRAAECVSTWRCVPNLSLEVSPSCVDKSNKLVGSERNRGDMRNWQSGWWLVPAHTAELATNHSPLFSSYGFASPRPTIFADVRNFW